jgi:hypothetical protein
MEANTIDIVSQWDQCGAALGAYLKQNSPAEVDYSNSESCHVPYDMFLTYVSVGDLKVGRSVICSQRGVDP